MVLGLLAMVTGGSRAASPDDFRAVSPVGMGAGDGRGVTGSKRRRQRSDADREVAQQQHARTMEARAAAAEHRRATRTAREVELDAVQGEGGAGAGAASVGEAESGRGHAGLAFGGCATGGSGRCLCEVDDGPGDGPCGACVEDLGLGVGSGAVSDGEEDDGAGVGLRRDEVGEGLRAAIPPGYVLAACPEEGQLRREAQGDGIVGSTVMVMWPGHGWCQGVVDRFYAGRTELDRSWSPPRPATFRVEFPVEEMHAMLHLAVERHWTARGEQEWSWALLAAERPRLDGATQRCGWPG